MKGSGDEGLAATNLVDEVTDLEGGPKLEAHVLHHHVTVQQQECLAIYLLKCTSLSSLWCTFSCIISKSNKHLFREFQGKLLAISKTLM